MQSKIVHPSSIQFSEFVAVLMNAPELRDHYVSKIEFNTDFFINDINDLEEILKLKMQDYKDSKKMLHTVASSEKIKSLD